MKIFGEKNPQLRGIKLTVPWHLEYLDHVNELLPNLESLDLTILEKSHNPSKKSSFWSGLKSIVGMAPRPVDAVHFRNVKNLTMNICDWYKKPQRLRYNEWTFDKMPKIQFERLQSYTLHTRNSQFSILRQIDLIGQNKGLTSVDIRYPLTYDQMVRLIDALPNLKDLKLECRNGEMVIDILRLMTRETSLDTILVYADSRRMSAFFGMRSMPGNWYLHNNFKKKRFLYKRKIGQSKKWSTYVGRNRRTFSIRSFCE